MRWLAQHRKTGDPEIPSSKLVRSCSSDMVIKACESSCGRSIRHARVVESEADLERREREAGGGGEEIRKRVLEVRRW